MVSFESTIRLNDCMQNADIEKENQSHLYLWYVDEDKNTTWMLWWLKIRIENAFYR